MKKLVLGLLSVFTISIYASDIGVTGMGYSEESALKNAAAQCVGYSNLDLVSFKSHGSYYSLNVLCKDYVNSQKILETKVGLAQTFGKAVENAKFQCQSENIQVIGDHKYANGVVLAFSICK